MRFDRGSIIRLLVIAAVLLTLAVMTGIDVSQKGITETDFMYAKVDGQRINVFEGKNGRYLFLPGYTSEEAVVLSAEAKKAELKIMKSSGIATIYITTNSESIDGILADKDHRERGNIRVIDESGNEDVSLGLDYIKGRGNYSWNNWEKKPFKIKLSKNASVLGLGMGKDYALIANSSDATLIRNDIARKLEMTLGIKYSGAGKFADLYINGDYMGNYYLCASIEVGKERIDITDMDVTQKKVFSRLNQGAFKVYETPRMKGWNLPECTEDISGGYLVEREFGDRYDLEYGSINNGFVTEGNEHFIVHSPDYCTVNEINYISDFFDRAEKEILSSEQYGRYIDVPSFAKRYLVEELIKNYDGGVSSAFYYKDRDDIDPKLYAGPGWDFDMILGNYLDWMEYSIEDSDGITQLYLSEHNSIYYRSMLSHREFTDLVHEYYRDCALGFMNDLVDGGIEDYRKLLSASAQMDSIRWEEMYERCGYSTGDKKSYEELSDFIRRRLGFLSGEWLD
ncbi:MAG: CotH kinase family protein [Butyrivibrio sp.]|nr:CotH kinase family protein [Butyrivibrio sp.]